MNAGVALAEGVGAVVDRARAFAERERGATPLFLQNLRQLALEALVRSGFPEPGHEEWRYFPVAEAVRLLSGCAGASGAANASRRPGARAALAAVAALGYAEKRQHQLVFVNGSLDPELSTLDNLPKGVHFHGISRLLEKGSPLVEPRLGLLRGHQRHPFVALNTAFLADGALLLVPDRVVCTTPLHVVNVTDGTDGAVATHPRVLLVLGENAQATVVETFVGAGPAFVNPVTEAYLGPHAFLDHYTLQEGSAEAAHVGTFDAHLAPGGQLFTHLFSAGSLLARNEASVHLHGDGAGLTMDGLYLGRNEQVVDNHVLVDHARPHCGSQQYYKGILDGKARGAFDGKVIVKPTASRTDAHQKNRNLLLSPEATVDSKPQLEIYNNDVKATHGSATGRLDPDALFYLRSRGFGETEARAALTLAFASEIAERIKVEPLRKHLEARVLAWLSGNGRETAS